MENLKNVLITGATKGLGRAILEQLAATGEYFLIGTGRSADAPCDWPAHLKGAYHQLELGDWRGHQDFISRLKKEYGPLYGIVNNAAIGLDGVLATMHESEIEKVITVNVMGTIVLTKYAVRTMLAERQGRVVNISSIIASTGFNGLSVYGASKSALLGFTRSLGRELGRANITVNSVSPGYMKTDMSSGISDENLERIKKRSPLGRLALPQDTAGVVELLLSQAGANITGIDIKVDAGSTI